MHERKVEGQVEHPRSRAAFLKTLGAGTAVASVAGLAARTDTAKASTDDDLAAHIAATTNVHAIPDTSGLAKYATAGTFTKPQSIVSDTAGVALSVTGFGADVLQLRGPDGLLMRFQNIASPGSRAGSFVFEGSNGSGRNGDAWAVGIDTAADTPYRDFFIGKIGGDSSVNDTFYISHRGASAPTIGLGWVTPRGDYRVSISGDDTDPGMGGLAIRVSRVLNPGTKIFSFIDSASGTPALSLEKSAGSKFIWHTTPQVDGFRIAAVTKASYPKTCLVMSDDDGSSGVHYTLADADGSLLWRSYNGSTARDVARHEYQGWQHLASKLGFYGAPTVTKQVVTGSRGRNDALRSLIAALAQLGLITDSTSN